MQVLADPARAAEQANVRTALAQLGRPARDVLTGVLDRADPKLAVQVILTLAEMKNPRALLSLLAPCWLGEVEVRAAAAAAIKQLTGRTPSRAEASRLLTDTAKTYLQQRLAFEGSVDGKVTLWHWEDEKHECAAKTYLVEDAARAMAARWAQTLIAWPPTIGIRCCVP